VQTILAASLTALLAAGSSVALGAQQGPDLVTPPPNILLSNYNTVPVGPNAGLEGGAYVARVGDPSAAWLNPAGLSVGKSAQLSLSSGAYQLATVSASALPNSGGSFQNIPSLVGLTVPRLMGGNWTLGIAVLTANSWTQSTDSQIVTTRPDGQERFAYSADSGFHQWVGAASLGYVSGRLRAGGGLALSDTSLSRNVLLSDRSLIGGSLTSIQIASRASGFALQLRPLAGVQFAVSPRVLVGAMIRTPAFASYTGGSYTSDGVANEGATSQGVSFFDPGAQFAYHFPFEISGGVGYVSPRVDLEFDAHAFTRVSAYTMLASAQPIVTYSDAATGTASIGTQPFEGFVTESRAVVNVAAGGHVALTGNGVWRVHFGLKTDQSPSGPNDQVFTHVNMVGGTLGVSGTKGRFQFTVGADYRTGSSSLVIPQVRTGGAIVSGIRVSSIGLIYSVYYRF
jgi:hypothetical protein